MKSNRQLLGIPAIPHGIITLHPLLPNPTALSHNPSPWASRTGLPACPSERTSDLNVRHLRCGMTNTARYSFLRAPRRFQASQPVGRKILAQCVACADSDVIARGVQPVGRKRVAQCVSTGRTTVPPQPRNGAEETGRRSFFRPVPGLANAARLLPTALRRGLLSCALRALRSCRGNRGRGTPLPRAGHRLRKPPSYSEFVKKNSLVTSFQFVPGSAASRSSAGRPPSAATAPASAGCRA